MTVALGRVAALVYRESGVRLAEHQYAFLQAALDRMGAGSAPEAFLREVADPVRGAPLLTRLIEEVTIQETSFLRDRRQLEHIDWRLLLQRARARGAAHVRVWTAACATGEEAYSLALLACEAFAPAPAPVSILATDISPDALIRARLGVYGSRSVRELEPALRRRYFREAPAGLVAGEQLRGLVTFARHNLVRDAFPPLGEAAFELILCRNVLIYFDEETVGRVVASFERALTASGTLVLGAADTLSASAARLRRCPRRRTRGPAALRARCGGRSAGCRPPPARTTCSTRPPTSIAAWRSSRAAIRRAPSARCAARCSWTRSSGSRRSSSRAPTRRSGTCPRRGALTSRRCERSSLTSDMSRSWPRSTSPTSPPRRRRASTCSRGGSHRTV